MINLSVGASRKRGRSPMGQNARTEKYPVLQGSLDVSEPLTNAVETP